MTQLAKPIELVKGIISDMQVFREQIGSLDDLNAEVKQAQRDVETWQHNLSMIKHEFAEVEAGVKKLEQQGLELDRKLDPLNAEIRAKTAERDAIVQEVQRLRARFVEG
jgi:chromosome segregation ATPase